MPYGVKIGSGKHDQYDPGEKNFGEIQIKIQ